MNRRVFPFLFVLPLVACPRLYAEKQPKAPQQREVKVQRTSLTRQQELELGKEAAAEVERTMEVVHNAEVEGWLNRIGQRLAATPQANAYPYYFKVVNDTSINAFALPGGPMYVHTGLIDAADNEDQVAGVLAHEMSHVALRHGANQMSKAQTWQTIMGAVNTVAGIAGGGQCGLLCQAVQMGGGLAENGLLMRFSRDHERDADLNGARMMASAGYNPMALARFFEKIESQQGAAASPRGLQSFLSSHPSPGNRVEYVEQDIRFYPKRDYNASAGSSFAKVQREVAALPPPKPRPGALLQPIEGQARHNLPPGLKDLQTKGFAIGYPDTWQVAQPQSAATVYIVPQGGAAKTQAGGVELILGAMVDYYQPQGGKRDLRGTTEELLKSLQQSDKDMRIATTLPAQLGGKPALLTTLSTRTSNQQDSAQTVFLYTVLRGDLLFNMALAAPPTRLNQAQPAFKQIAETVLFKD